MLLEVHVYNVVREIHGIVFFHVFNVIRGNKGVSEFEFKCFNQ